MRHVASSVVALCMFCCAGLCQAQLNIQLGPNGEEYTAVLFNGASQMRYDLVFIGDGFTVEQQADFNAAVDRAVSALHERQPYGNRMCAFNVWRVNVISDQAGVDHPMQRTFRNTALDCRYGDTAQGEAERCILSDSPLKCVEAASHAPDRDAIVVLVNDTAWGGCAPDLIFSSICNTPDFTQIITHELGHKIATLADEYSCYRCDGSDDARPWPGGTHWAANLTTDLNRTTTKWASKILATTPLPTTQDTPTGVVGLWEGGGYFATGIFRPQQDCHMRTTDKPFCAVCDEELSKALSARCSPCELLPTPVGCLNVDLLQSLKIVWREPVIIRRPIPPCLTCPPGSGPERVSLRVAGTPAGFSLRVLDDRGNVVARDDSTRGGLRVEFLADPMRSYVTDLVSDGTPTQRRLNITTELTRNGRRQELPSL